MKLVVAAADYFRDVGLHRQLTTKLDPEITNGLRRTDHREPNHIISVLAALSCSLRDAHHEVMSLIQLSSVCRSSDTLLAGTPACHQHIDDD